MRCKNQDARIFLASRVVTGAASERRRSLDGCPPCILGVSYTQHPFLLCDPRQELRRHEVPSCQPQKQMAPGLGRKCQVTPEEFKTLLGICRHMEAMPQLAPLPSSHSRLLLPSSLSPPQSSVSSSSLKRNLSLLFGCQGTMQPYTTHTVGSTPYNCTQRQPWPLQ